LFLFTPKDTAQKGGAKNQAIGRSKGGWTTKILALTDALGNLVRFCLLPGNRYDTIGVACLIEGIHFGGIITDKAFDADWIIEEMNRCKSKIVISQRPQRKQPLKIDKEIYKCRHLIENLLNKIQDYKAIAMRCEKTDRNFSSFITPILDKGLR